MNTLLLYHQKTTEIDDQMLWKQSAIDQMLFMRETVGFGLLNVPVFIIGKHRSKSIELPVYGLVFRSGIKMMVSYNFYCWVVSVELPDTLPEDYLPKDLFTYGVDKEVPYYYGFKKEWEYGCYSSKSLRFTVELEDKYRVFTMIYLLSRAFPPKIYQEERDKKSIQRSIEEIYKANGFYEFCDYSKDLGLEKPTMNPIMNGWEIMWGTYYILENVGRKGGESYKNLSEAAEDPKLFSEYICKYPEVLSEFLFTKDAFSTVF